MPDARPTVLARLIVLAAGLIALAGLAGAGPTSTTGPVAPQAPATALSWHLAEPPIGDATARTGRSTIAWTGVGEHPAVAPDAPVTTAGAAGVDPVPTDATAEQAERTSPRRERAPPAGTH